MKADFSLMLSAALVIAAAPVSAQLAPGAPGTNQTIPEKDRSRPQEMPRDRAPAQEDGVVTGRSSSEQRDAEDGVIRPPKGVDPGIVAPTPETKSPMPVIPPPGTPGGPPGPQPK